SVLDPRRGVRSFLARSIGRSHREQFTISCADAVILSPAIAPRGTFVSSSSPAVAAWKAWYLASNRDAAPVGRRPARLSAARRASRGTPRSPGPRGHREAPSPGSLVRVTARRTILTIGDAIRLCVDTKVTNTASIDPIDTAGPCRLDYVAQAGRISPVWGPRALAGGFVGIWRGGRSCRSPLRPNPARPGS